MTLKSFHLYSVTVLVLHLLILHFNMFSIVHNWLQDVDHDLVQVINPNVENSCIINTQKVLDLKPLHSTKMRKLSIRAKNKPLVLVWHPCQNCSWSAKVMLNQQFWQENAQFKQARQPWTSKALPPCSIWRWVIECRTFVWSDRCLLRGLRDAHIVRTTFYLDRCTLLIPDWEIREIWIYSMYKLGKYSNEGITWTNTWKNMGSNQTVDPNQMMDLDHQPHSWTTSLTWTEVRLHSTQVSPYTNTYTNTHTGSFHFL